MSAELDIPLAPAAKDVPSGWAFEWGMVRALVRRDLLRLKRERSRWLGLVAQPLLLWAVIGLGMADSFTVPGAEGGSALHYFYPGLLAMVVLFTSIFTTMAVIEDRHSGFLQMVRVAPASSAAFVVGKTLGVTAIVLVQAALFLLAAPLAGYSFASIDWPSLLAVLLLGNAALTAVNLVFAWWLDSTQGYHALMGVLLMPLWIVSGAMFPAPDNAVGKLVAINPMAYGVSGLRTALGSDAGALVSGPTSIAVLGGFAAVFLAIAVLVTRRR